MPNNLQQMGTLYSGRDLENAAELSTLQHSLRDHLAGYANGLAVLRDAVRYRRRQTGAPSLELTSVTGTMHGSSTQCSITYLGSGANRAWCIATALSDCEKPTTATFASAAQSVESLCAAVNTTDIIFIEDIDDSLVTTLPVNFVRIPAWVKQRTRVVGEWPEQIQSLGGKLCKEISRVLHKYQYQCRLTREEADISHFYDQLYEPYIRSLYGTSAIVVDRERFLRECQRGVLLQLTANNAIVAAALLRPIGRTMAIVWTGMIPGTEAKRVPGAADAMDYFSLLYAHLKGCRWLDFGPSRPDLNDGALRYKRKWGTQITAGYFEQPPIYWSCTNRSGGAGGNYLRQHAYITRSGNKLNALAFICGDGSEAEITKATSQLLTPGIAGYQIICMSPVRQSTSEILAETHPNMTLIKAESVAAAMQIAS